MQYQKTINLWAGDNEQRLRDGRLRLQCGQWVKCGNDPIKSRYIGIFGLSVWVAHGVDHKAVVKRFKLMVASAKGVNNV